MQIVLSQKQQKGTSGAHNYIRAAAKPNSEASCTLGPTARLHKGRSITECRCRLWRGHAHTLKLRGTCLQAGQGLPLLRSGKPSFVSFAAISPFGAGTVPCWPGDGAACSLVCASRSTPDHIAGLAPAHQGANQATGSGQAECVQTALPAATYV